MSQAQNTFSAATDSDPEATKILGQLKSTFETYDAIELDFTIGIEFPGEGIEEQKGTILQKEESFILEMPDQSLYCNGEIVWVYLKEMNEVQINDADFDEESMFISPKDIFNMYSSGEYVYGITFQGEEAGVFLTQIEFKPLDEDSEYSKMRLTLDKENEVKNLKVFSKDGSRYTMTINQLTNKKGIVKDVFNFKTDDYPDITVEDLRL